MEVRESSRAELSPESVRNNNFDLIRLIAALEVVLQHAALHLTLPGAAVINRIDQVLPGVPIFFVVSGFWVYVSWQRSASVTQYLRKRFLRIYPALWVCLAFSLTLFLISGGAVRTANAFLVWTLAQISIFQFYNPPFLRSFGTGVLNGSMWTIPVELEFYLVLPLLAMLGGRKTFNWLMIGVAGFCVMLVSRLALLGPLSPARKLLGFSLLPYLFYFLVGIFGQRAYERAPSLFRGKAAMWAAAYVSWLVIAKFIGVEIPLSPAWSGLSLIGPTARGLDPVSLVLLGMLTISAGFSLPGLGWKLLRGNDLSYGIYLYHMPLMNALLVAGILGLRGFLALMLATSVCAMASWRLVERPALSLKYRALRVVHPGQERESIRVV